MGTFDSPPMNHRKVSSVHDQILARPVSSNVLPSRRTRAAIRKDLSQRSIFGVLPESLGACQGNDCERYNKKNATTEMQTVTAKSFIQRE